MKMELTFYCLLRKAVLQRVVLGAILCMAGAFSMAYAGPYTKDDKPADNAWIKDATIKGIEFYHTLSECNGRKVVFLKLNNTNNSKVEVSWKEIFTTQEGPRIEGYFGKKNLVLNTGEIKETDCKNPVEKELLVSPGQVNPTYIADISKFGYTAITVTEIK